MKRIAPNRFLTALACVAILTSSAATLATAQAPPVPQASPQIQPQNSTTTGNKTITLSVGTRVQLAMTSPVWAKSVKLGADIYCVSAFPVAINGEMAIPAGTYAQGTIDAMALPTWRSGHAAFQMHFTKLIFANGYTVGLPAGTAITSGTAIAMAYVNVASSSDVLLDIGSQIELILQSPLPLDAKKTAGAARVSKPMQLAQFKSATRCRPTAGTAGTPDTVIPGSSGTPDTVILGGPGMPDIVIPGMAPTPPTVISGSPGTPGTTCPGPPIVSSTPSDKDAHNEAFQVKSPIQVAGQNLPAGNYQVTWLGLGPIAWVDILQKGKAAVHAQARISASDNKAPANNLGLHTNADGSVSLISIQFKGKTLELFFNQGGARPCDEL